MKRASFFLPEDLIARLATESRRTGIPIAEMVRRALDATVPPAQIGFGQLRRFVDRQGYLKVMVLSARDGKFLVSPGDGYTSAVAIWVDADLVKFEGQPVPLPMKESDRLGFGLNMNIKADDPEEPK